MKCVTYNAQYVDCPNTFFILSKGLNSGRPSSIPNPNSFQLSFNNKEERDLYFWYFYALWTTNYFKNELIGSVIPFIKIKTIHHLLQQSNLPKLNSTELRTFISHLNDVKRLEDVLSSKRKLIAELKKAYCKEYISKIQLNL